MSTIKVIDALGVTQTVNVLPANGQATSVNSQPVVIASDQTPLSVGITNFPTSQVVTGPATDTQMRATPIPVSISGIALPTGASTSANQASIVTALGNLGTTSDVQATSDSGTFSIVALIKRSLSNWTTLFTKLPTLVSGRIPTDGSGVTQPISGSVTITGTSAISGTVTANAGTGFTGMAQETGNLASILAKLPSSPATSALQPVINADGGAQSHIMNFPATQPISGSVTITGTPAISGTVTANAGTGFTGMAQETGNLASILAKLPSAPATSTAQASLLALQPALNADGGSLSHITNFPATQPISGSVTITGTPAISGTVTANAGTGFTGMAQETGNLASILAKLPSAPALATNQAAINADGGVQSHVMNFPATQPISGSVTANAGTGFTGMAQETGNLASILAKLPSAPALATNQATINADGGAQSHIMNFPATQPISGSVTITGTVSSSMPLGSTETDRSGTIIAASVAQVVMATNSNRKYFEIQNLSTTNMLWFRKDGNVAVVNGPGSFALSVATASAPGGFYSGTSTGMLSVISTLIGHNFTVIEA